MNDFKPTPHMKLWMDTAIQNLESNTSKVAERCNISRQSWYRWIQDDNFRWWFSSQWNKALAIHSWRLDAIGLQKAETDFRYWQAMQNKISSVNPAEQEGHFNKPLIILK